MQKRAALAELVLLFRLNTQTKRLDIFCLVQPISLLFKEAFKTRNNPLIALNLYV